MPRPETRPPPYARYATASDLDSLFRLTRGFSTSIGLKVDDTLRQHALELLVTVSALGRILVTEERGSVSGYASLTYGFDLMHGGRTAVLTELYIVPEWRECGRARALFALARETAREAGAHVFHLLDDAGSPDGRKLYKGMGAHKDGRTIWSLPLD